jgi:hypothetical protein
MLPGLARLAVTQSMMNLTTDGFKCPAPSMIDRFAE